MSSASMSVRVAPASERVEAIQPTSMSELMALAKAAAGSGFFGAKTPDQALLVCLSGRDLGLSYAQSLRAFHVIEGKPCLSADGMVAACLVRRDVCEFFRTIEVTDKRATVETKRVGQDAQRYTFTLEDAQRAEVAHKPTWKRYPSRMLLARARAALARDVYPDLLLGLYDPDEIGEVAVDPAQIARTTVVASTRAPVVTADGEVVEKVPAKGSDSAPQSHSQGPERADQFAAFLSDYARQAREGTMAGHAAIGSRVLQFAPVGDERAVLVKAARESAAAIRHRVTATREAQSAFGAGSDPTVES